MLHDEDEDPGYDESNDDNSGDGIEVSCPYCGELVAVAIDMGGGSVQEYTEDCPVCCRPWRVHVQLTRNGSAEVHLEEENR